jgi:hypothetical protein
VQAPVAACPLDRNGNLNRAYMLTRHLVLPPDQRREVATSIHAEWTKTVRVRQSNNAVYLTRARFISYYMMWDKMSEDEAGKKWESELRLPPCDKRTNSQGQVLVVVQDNPSATGEFETAQSRSVSSSGVVSGPDQLAEAQHWVGEFGENRTFQDQAFQSLGSSVFSAASGSHGEELMLQGVKKDMPVTNSEPKRLFLTAGSEIETACSRSTAASAERSEAFAQQP